MIYLRVKLYRDIHYCDIIVEPNTKRFKRTKHNMHIFLVIPFIKLQNNT